MKYTCSDCMHWKHRLNHGDNVGICKIANSNCTYDNDNIFYISN